MTKKVGINGFGRIGKLVYKILIKRGYNVPLINDPIMTSDGAVYTLRYDSVHREGPFTSENDTQIKKIDDYTFQYKNCKTKLSNCYNPSEIEWEKHEVDIVIEASGFFLTQEKAQAHIGNSNRKVIITAPSPDAPMFVYGVNHQEMKKDQKIVSNASCTTNCLAPLAKVLHDEFGIVEGLMTTIHSITASQKTVDTFSTKDYGVGRSSYNIIPSSTGAAKAVGKVIPELNGKLTGMAFRVPTTDVSVVDLTVKLQKSTNLKEIFSKIRESKMKNIITTTSEKVVSSDLIGCNISSIVSETACIELNDTFFKIVAWYDNEWGYSERVVDLLTHMGSL
ncbi:glyceraldehyde-3-phosphate dehydrogenase, type I [Pseudoloma neurophilia]|uniref:Glyceraldehyde-3-phosphate dehydrogenase n=1 Tax=Pseudoloma neurophilia TaxID=146866 RepID=A0A0R0LX20_9MICR|nr:glyceraldehyde-3-phosphate dehydrogenase, type I [Pseudoloma neurophilia]